MEDIYSIEALFRAHLKARKNKRYKNEVIRFEMHLAENLMKLRRRLLNQKGWNINYYHFVIHEPKRREVYATDYATRVALHVLCDEVLKSLIGQRLIYDNTACQERKGTHFALKRLTYFLTSFYRKYGTGGYVLKCDIRKYFEEIDQEILLEKLYKLTKNSVLFETLRAIILSYHGSDSKKGLPLGNQTSQWFALYYLDRMDRYIKEIKQEKYYIRYMDDFLILSPSKQHLQELLIDLKELLAEEKLFLNHKTQIYPLTRGFEFLGFRFILKKTGKVIRRLRTSTKKRMVYRLKKYYKEDLEHCSLVKDSYLGHLKHGTCYFLAMHVNELGYGGNDERLFIDGQEDIENYCGLTK